MRDQTYRTIFSQPKDIWVFGDHLSLQPFSSEPESSTHSSCSWLSLTNESTANHKHGALAVLHNISLASSSSQERIRDLYGWEESQKITQSRLMSQGRIIILMSNLRNACLTSSWKQEVIPHPLQIFLCVIILTACHLLTSNPNLLFCSLSSSLVLSIIYMAKKFFPFSSQTPFTYLTAVTLSGQSLL